MSGIGSYLGFEAQALTLREERNGVLASNIANAATPNYKARDFDFASALQRATSDQGVLDGSGPGQMQPGPQDGVQLGYRDPVTPSLDGNTVEPAVEQMQFSQNVMGYQTSLAFLNNRITTLMTAIKGQ